MPLLRALLGGVLAALLLASSAQAQVHLGRLRGPRAAQVRAALRRGLEGAGHTLAEETTQAAATVEGRVLRRRGRWRAVLELRTAGSTETERLRAAARTPRALGARLARRVVAALAGAEEARAGAAPAEEQRRAVEDARRVVVGTFRGRGARQVREAVVSTFASEARVALVPRAELEASGEDLASAAGLRRGAAPLGVSAYLTGTVIRRGSRWSARVTVRSASDGSVVEEVPFRGRTLRALVGVVRRRGWERLGAAVLRTAPAASGAELGSEQEGGAVVNGAVGVPIDDPIEPAESAESTESVESAVPGRPNTLDLALVAHPFSRRLRYNDDLYGLLREYTLPFGPAVRLAVRWYPGALATAGWGAHLGVDLRWEQAFAIDSKRADGEVFPTRSRAWYLGLRGRVPLGRHEVSVGVGYGRHSFVIDSAGPSQPGRLNIPQVPGVDYRGLWFQAEARLAPIAGLRVVLHGATAVLFDLGGIGSDLWFPRAKAGGIDAGILLGWETPAGVELRLGWDVRRYFYRFDPEVGDPFIAGGAVDQYFGYTLGLAYRL